LQLKNAPGFVTAMLQLLAMQTDDTIKQAGAFCPVGKLIISRHLPEKPDSQAMES